ncbi:MAG: hypothetical protein JWQ06_1751 [Mucilaginibacter sp.]|nr:hypothetical protein [Mucilaginibacter sp.]
MNIQEYIESGVLETYVMGSASETEAKELLYLKEQYPEIQNALQELEMDMEHIAGYMAITPPPGVWTKISDTIDEITITPKPESSKLVPDKEEHTHNADNYKQEKYIEVEAESNYMRVHKTWKWVFAAVFILAKIFLIAAIYFYLENRQAQQQLQELKKELKNIHGNR